MWEKAFHCVLQMVCYNKKLHCFFAMKFVFHFPLCLSTECCSYFLHKKLAIFTIQLDGNVRSVLWQDALNHLWPFHQINTITTQKNIFNPSHQRFFKGLKPVHIHVINFYCPQIFVDYGKTSPTFSFLANCFAKFCVSSKVLQTTQKLLLITTRLLFVLFFVCFFALCFWGFLFSFCLFCFFFLLFFCLLFFLQFFLKFV